MQTVGGWPVNGFENGGRSEDGRDERYDDEK